MNSILLLWSFLCQRVYAYMYHICCFESVYVISISWSRLVLDDERSKTTCLVVGRVQAAIATHTPRNKYSSVP